MPRDVDITRYGGELKLNLSTGVFLPYLTLGTGIQEIEAEGLNLNKQIFIDAGVGVIISAGDRVTLGLQAINSRYRYNAGASLMSDEERLAYEVDPADFRNEIISNWSGRATLGIYLGGRRPSELSRIDEAYKDNFSSGFSGLNIPIGVEVSKMDFDADLPYRDTWLGGAEGGLNFGPLVGIRAFYWRSLEDGRETDLDFDELSMYGGMLNFKLNDGKGISPWLSVGGGNIHVSDEYIGRDVDLSIARNKPFALGGVGLDVPLSKAIKLRGFVRSILTTNEDYDDFSQPSDINTSWSYGGSLNFVIGRQKEEVKVVEIDDMQDALHEMDRKYEDDLRRLEKEYDERIKQMKKDGLSKEDMRQLLDERDAIDLEIKSRRISRVQKHQSTADGQSNQSATTQESRISMTPGEFESLIEEILENVQRMNPPTIQPAHPTPPQMLLIPTPSTEDKMKNNDVSSLDKQNEDINVNDDQVKKLNGKIAQLQKQINQLKKEMNNAHSASDKRIDNRTKQLNNKINQMQRTVNQLKAQMQNRDQSLNNLDAQDQMQLSETNQTPVMNNQQKVKYDANYVAGNGDGFFSTFRYKGMSGLAGMTFGKQLTTFNLGYRLHYRVGKPESNLEFMPESYFGFGSPSSFGLSANGIYYLNDLVKSDYVNPYIGAGLGLLKVGDNANEDRLKGAINLIAGSTLNLGAGDFYADITFRNGFNYAQVALGYRFPF